MESVAESTMVTELSGISMAAITGDKFPLTAKNNPVMLYISETAKVIKITFLPARTKSRKDLIFGKALSPAVLANLY